MCDLPNHTACIPSVRCQAIAKPIMYAKTSQVMVKWRSLSPTVLSANPTISTRKRCNHSNTQGEGGSSSASSSGSSGLSSSGSGGFSSSGSSSGFVGAGWW